MPSEFDQFLSSPRRSEFDDFLTTAVAEPESEFDEFLSPPAPKVGIGGIYSRIGGMLSGTDDAGDRTETTPELLGRVGRSLQSVPASPVPGVAQFGKALDYLMSPPEDVHPPPRTLRPLPAHFSLEEQAEHDARLPYRSELEFFSKNPDVSGMAAEDGRVVINPFARLTPAGGSSTILNENVRLYLDENKITPEFDLTPKQKQFFAAYSPNERDVKNTVLARIIAGDKSAQDVTVEQRRFAEKVHREMQEDLPDDWTFGVPDKFWGNLAKGVAQFIPGVVELPRKLLSPSLQDKADAIHEIAIMMPSLREDVRSSLGEVLGPLYDIGASVIGDEEAQARLAQNPIGPAVSALMLVAPFGSKAKAELTRRKSLTEQGRMAESTTIPEMRRSEGIDMLRRTEAEIKRQSEFDQYVMERDELGQRIAGERAAEEGNRLSAIDRETRRAEAKQREGMANLADTEAGIKADVAEGQRASAWDQYIRDRENLEPPISTEKTPTGAQPTAQETPSQTLTTKAEIPRQSTEPVRPMGELPSVPRETPPEAPTAVPLREARFAQPEARPETPKVQQERMALEIETALREAGLPEEAQPAIGLNKAGQDQIRRTVGQIDLPDVQARKWEPLFREVKESGLDQRIMDVVDEVVRTRRGISDREHAAMVLKAADLMNQWKASLKLSSELVEQGKTHSAKREFIRRKGIEDQIDALTEASRMSRREVARSLSIGRMAINRLDYSIESVAAEMRSVKGKPLTPKEEARITYLAKENERLSGQLIELESRMAELRAKQMKERAEIVTAKIKNEEAVEVKAGERRQSIAKEKKEILDKLTELGFRVNDITGVSAEGMYLVGRYAIALMREGEFTLERVVRRVKEKLPDLAEVDIYEAINSRDPKIQRKAANAVDVAIRQNKIEADLLVKIDRAAKGIFDATAKDKPQTPERILELRRELTALRLEVYRNTKLPVERLQRAQETLNELQDQLANAYRRVKEKPRTINDLPEMAGVQAQIKELRTHLRLDDVMADLLEQQRTGNYKIPQRELPPKLPPEIMRKQLELNRVRRQIRQEIAESEPLTVGKGLSEFANTMRTLKATADFSGIMRQGAFQTARQLVTQPDKAVRSHALALKAAFKRYTADEILQQIQRDQDYYLMDRAKLEFTESEGAGARVREEHFNSRFLEKLGNNPVTRPIWEVIAGSERHMTTYLNLVRYDAFKDFLQKYPNATDAELAAWARWINVTTGRGKIPYGAGALLQHVVFAPRFAWSRFETAYVAAKELSPQIKKSVSERQFVGPEHPRVATEIAKDITSLGGLIGSTLALAKLAGLEVGMNPNDPDFGKIVWGGEGEEKSRIDLFAGFQQVARLAFKLTLGWAFPQKDQQVEGLTDAITRFVSYKASPLITTSDETYTALASGMRGEGFVGKTAVGEDVTLPEIGIRAITPMVIEDALEIARSEGGWARSSLLTSLIMVGASISTYPDSEKKTRAKIRELKEAGKYEEAEALQIKWNDANPDNRIVKVEVE